MKKTRILIFAVLCMMLLPLLCACGGDGEEAKKVELASLTDLAEYKIVRAENSTDAEKDAMVALNNAIREKTGISLKVSTDYYSATKEILVGKTKRQQSLDAAEGLTYNDFVIKQDGPKLVIVGGSDKAITDAVNYFIENFIDGENKTLKVPTGDGFSHILEYKLDGFIVGGISLEKFKIRATEKTSEMAIKLRDDILNTYLGYELPIDEKEMVDDEHYIIFDASSLDYGSYSITVGEGNITICGSARSINAAVREFYGLMDNTAGGTLELAAEGAITGTIAVPEIPYKSKDELLKVLEDLQSSDKLIFGQHLAGGMDLNKSIAQYTEAVGEGPAIMDIDMLNLKSNSKETWSELICQAVEYAGEGGIITTMHHWQNPLHPEEGYRGRLDSLDQWEEVLTKGTELNKKWHEELDRGAEFLKALDDAGVSVMFRPMHEANGNWFWFCAGYGDLGYIDSRDMIAMWKYVHNYYTKDYELGNILWSYGPNISNSSENPVTYYYPGDEYCDVVGIDWYTNGSYELDGAGKSWENLLDYRKPTGLTEWGIGDALRTEDPAQQSSVWSCENYVETLERMHEEGKAIAFAEVYSGRFGAPSYVGRGEALANYDKIISLEEMPAYIKEVLGK